MQSASQIMEGVKESTGIDVNALISGVIGGKIAAGAAKKTDGQNAEVAATETEMPSDNA